MKKIILSVLSIFAIEAIGETNLNVSCEDQCGEILSTELGGQPTAEISFECAGPTQLIFRGRSGILKELWIRSEVLFGIDYFYDFYEKGEFEIKHGPTDSRLKCEWEKIEIASEINQ